MQQALVEFFETWGCPDALRVDNGLPLGDPGSDLPPPLALWLIGLGVEVLWNRPYQPTDNAKVERMQGVTVRWAEPRQCATPQVLQGQLDAVVELQRCHYRVRHLGGRRRTEAYPDLIEGGRSYRAAGFDLERVLCFLSRGMWVRKVSKTGQISFYRQRWHLGARYRRQRVWIHLDREKRQWVIQDEAGAEVRRVSSAFMTVSSIGSLSLSQRRGNR